MGMILSCLVRRLDFLIKASEDAYNVMGYRLYSNQILLPDLQCSTGKVEKRYEVTDSMELIQYLSSIDKKPAHLGGRNNGWRELNIMCTEEFIKFWTISWLD
jgi:hypothetical protein